MAKETKFIDVSPSAVEKTIEQWGWFGWELMGAPQEVKTQDAQIYTGQGTDGTKYFETTKGEHYVKITFQREKSNPNYAELCELEQKYNNSQVPSEPYRPVAPEKKKIGGCAWGAAICVALGGVAAICSGDKEGVMVGIFVLIIIIGTFIGAQMIYKSKYSKEHAIWTKGLDDWQKRHNEWEKKSNEITKMRHETIERAKALVG